MTSGVEGVEKSPLRTNSNDRFREMRTRGREGVQTSKKFLTSHANGPRLFSSEGAIIHSFRLAGQTFTRPPSASDRRLPPTSTLPPAPPASSSSWCGTPSSASPRPTSTNLRLESSPTTSSRLSTSNILTMKRLAQPIIKLTLNLGISYQVVV